MRPRRPTPRTARQSTRRLDQLLARTQIPQRPSQGWVRAVREALGMTQKTLARRIGISRPSVAALESGETGGNVTLARLRRAADALGCDLEYVLIPRQPLEDMVAHQAARRAERRLSRINQSQALEASSVTTTSLSAAVKDLAQEYQTQRPSDLWDD